MKKILISIIAIALVLSLASCEWLFPIGTTTTGSGSTSKSTSSSTSTSTSSTTTTSGKNTPTDEDIIGAVEVLGGNESISLYFEKIESYTYAVYYKLKDADDSDYVKLDDELMIADENAYNCYILGITEGVYKVKIEATSKTNGDVFFITLTNIEVALQDRSGYAHFGANEGVGAYNNDGTLKEGTKIIYVTNENKNTVTCRINGTEYVGLVNILQAQYKSSTPMLIRIIGKITTNQWNYKNVEP